MRKIVTVGVVFFAVAFFATAVFAFDIGGSVKVPTNKEELKDAGGKVGLKTGLDKVLEQVKCSFKGNTLATTCDLKDLANKLAVASRAAGETSKKYSIGINIEAAGSSEKKNPVSASERADKVRDTLKASIAQLVTNPWDFNVKASGATDNSLKITVDVK